MTEQYSSMDSAQVAALEARLADLAKSKAKLELVNRLLVSLSSVAGLENMVGHILQILMETIGAVNISLYYRMDALWHYRDIYGTAWQAVELDNPGILKALSAGEPLRIFTDTAPYPDVVGSTPTQTWIFPLFSSERQIGAVCMEGMQLIDEGIFQDLLPFFVYAGLMLDNEICNYNQLVEAHRKLQDSETIYRSLFEQSPDGIQLTDPADTKAIFFNSAMHRQLGYTSDEYAQLTVADYEGIEDTEQIFARIQALRETGSVTFESSYRTKLGEILNVYVSLRFIMISGRSLILAIVRDISELKRTENALKASELKFRTLFTTLQDAVFLTSASDGSIVECNDKLSGYSRVELLGKSTMELNLWADMQQRQQVVEQVSKNGSVNDFEALFRKKDGTVFPGSISTNAVCLNGETFLLSVVRDITERKHAEEEQLKLEQQLLHAQKLESLGVLAGGIAHDFNNILTTIIGNADLALMRLSPESPVLENLQRIEKAAARAADLARQMLAYSGKGKFVVESIDLNRIVEEMGHMLDVSISKKALLRYNLAKPLPGVDADATQLRQIIMNLVINASEAIGDKSGVIAVTTGCLECDQAYLKDAWLSDQIPQGLYVFLEIADTGCGMDRETMNRIFDPFFTTKFAGRGLGMAAVLGIVRGHKGAIKVYSEPGRGSIFKVLLPAGERPVELFNADGAIDNWHGSGVVLLVDDEETVRGIGGDMLKELGFTPITANDGREAVAIYKSRPEIIFVILDLTMPHMDGEQCFRELQRHDANVKVIMSSGFSEQDVTRKFTGKGLAGFVQKPYKLSALRDVIRNMLP